MHESNYHPNGHLIEMADRFVEVVFDDRGNALTLRDDGPIGPVMWFGAPGPMTPQMRAAGWIDMSEKDDDDE